MDLYYSHLPDETLFQMMSQGNRQAQGILLHRYEHAGFQCFKVLAKQYSLNNYRAIDFIDVIDETIYKSFKYYRLNERKYRTYCYELINQALTKEISEVITETTQLNDILYLDSPVGSEDFASYHDVISDSYRLSAPEEYNMKEFLIQLVENSSPKARKAIEIYEYHLYGLSHQEIADMLGITVYKVRTSIEDAEKMIEDKKRKLRFN